MVSTELELVLAYLHLLYKIILAYLCLLYKVILGYIHLCKVAHFLWIFSLQPFCNNVGYNVENVCWYLSVERAFSFMEKH